MARGVVVQHRAVRLLLATGLVFGGLPARPTSVEATAAIIDRLNLVRPIYRSTTNYGHFARPGLPWEAVEKAAAVAK